MPDTVKFDGTIKSVVHLLEHIGYSKLTELPQAHLRMWFRGQENKAWPLQPGVYRESFQAKTEDDRLERERQLTQDFRVESAGILTRHADDAELYFVQQHYRMPTRLLDWTANPLAALYFAVAKEEETDGALFLMDAFGLATTQKIRQMKVATGQHKVFTDAMKRIYWWSDDFPFPNFIFPVRPDHFDKRMMLQKSGFTFHVPDHGQLTKAENDTLQSYEIPARAKRGLLRELAVLGVDEFSIFGDLDSLSNRLRRAYKIH
jgi:hypothetical protein